MSRTPEEVGEIIRERRLSLDEMTVKDAATTGGFSDTTWTSLEAGHKVSDRTVRGAARSLEWPLDFYRRLLAGEDPVGFPHTVHATARATLGGEETDFASEYNELPPDDQQIVRDLVRRLKGTRGLE